MDQKITLRERAVLLISVLILSQSFVSGQSTSKSIPESPVPSKKYLFYLHGGVVQQQGENAVSKYYGEYKYRDILDSLSHRGFYVISEVRSKETDEVTYAQKLKLQIDSLIAAGVSPQNVTIVGASQGAYIALETAIILKNPQVNYVLLGLCSEYALQYFSKYKQDFSGRFLSIYERSDVKKSCREIFADLSGSSSFKEVQLNLGNSHAFLFKPHSEWIAPLVRWSHAKNPKN